MLLAERAGRKLERWSNSAPRGMAVIAHGCKTSRRNKIRPIGLLHFFRLRLQCAAFFRSKHGLPQAPWHPFIFLYLDMQKHMCIHCVVHSLCAIST